MVKVTMCGFLLAVEQKKWKTLLRVWKTLLGTGVRGFLGHMACVRFSFLFCHLPLPDTPHPLTGEVLVECVK